MNLLVHNHAGAVWPVKVRPVLAQVDSQDPSMHTSEGPQPVSSAGDELFAGLEATASSPKPSTGQNHRSEGRRSRRGSTSRGERQELCSEDWSAEGTWA